ncbi:MAG: signal peptidase I, partial [Candidatus Methylomirabilia bacterium]
VQDLFAQLLEEGGSIRCVVNGGSMEPCIRKGDVVTVRPATFPEVRIGDILVFRSNAAPHRTPLTAHRVIRKSTRSRKPCLYVRGDANVFGNWVTPDAIAGTVAQIQRGSQVIGLTQRWSRLRSYVRAYVSECTVLWSALVNAFHKIRPSF